MEREARYQNIVVVVTESCDCEPAFERALKLAQAHGAALSLLDIADAVPDEARVLFPAEKLAALEASFAQERSAMLARCASVPRKWASTSRRRARRARLSAWRFAR